MGWDNIARLFWVCSVIIPIVTLIFVYRRLKINLFNRIFVSILISLILFAILYYLGVISMAKGMSKDIF